jgi:hypothetical protein
MLKWFVYVNCDLMNTYIVRKQQKLRDFLLEQTKNKLQQKRFRNALNRDMGRSSIKTIITNMTREKKRQH